MASDPQSDRTSPSDKPSRNPDDWFDATVFLAIAVGCCFFGAFFFVIAGESDRISALRAQYLAPFGVALFALVTLTTIVWRGLLTNEQVRQQTRQNDAKDEENLAKLLQDGAKLLAEPEKTSQLHAGVVSLDVVVRDPRRRLSQQALDVLAAFYAGEYSRSPMAALEAARTCLIKAAEAGLRSSVDANFVGQKDTVWKTVRGFRSQIYEGGRISSVEFEAMADEMSEAKAVTFRHTNISTRIELSDCRLENCNIKVISLSSLRENTFVGCNFSGCVFMNDPLRELLSTMSKGNSKIDLKSGQNWFDKSNPPEDTPYFSWSEQLEPRDDDNDILYALQELFPSK